jgi:hypothetical protein
MNGNSFERKRRQFVNLSNRINHLLINKKWEELSASVKATLIAKLNSLYMVVKRYFSVFAIKKALAAAAVFIAMPFISKSQAFDPPLQNPFGYVRPASTTFGAPAFADLDNDGDFDLLIGGFNYNTNEGKVLFFQNSGTKTSPAFAAAQNNPFGLMPLTDYPLITLADIDKDGDIDLFVGGYSGHILFFKNDGTPEVPTFATAVVNPFNITNIGTFAFPTFADIDHDGDLDMFVCGSNGKMHFFENIGTANLPDFTFPQEDPFGITPVHKFGAPAFADLDHDGDLDLLEGEYTGAKGNTLYFENTGTATTPAFAAPVTNPFGIVAVSYYVIPALADLDNDGDLDLVLGEYWGDIQYFKNTEINVGIPDISPAGAFELYPNPATDKVVITLKETIPPKPIKVLIMDAQGKILGERKLNKQVTELDMDQFSPGIYYVRLISDQIISSRKLIIK